MDQTINATISDYNICSLRKLRDKKKEHAGRLDFKRISADDMKTLLPFLAQENGRTTDFSYGGILMWVDYYDYEFCIFNGTMFIKGLSEDNRMVPSFSLPVGKMSVKECVDLLEGYCQDENIRLQFSAVPEYAVSEFENLNPKCIEELKDYADYLYPSEQLCTLSGKKMAKKRNRCNKFEIENPDWNLSPLTKENLKEALEFMDLYDKERDKNAQAEKESLLSRKIITQTCCGNAILTGAVLTVGDRIAALTVGDIKDDTLFIHIEKADKDIQGSYEIINREFAKLVCGKHPEIKYINREDDCGDIGLRMAKESYHPLKMLKKYNIFF